VRSLDLDSCFSLPEGGKRASGKRYASDCERAFVRGKSENTGSKGWLVAMVVLSLMPRLLVSTDVEARQ
jgi:hypothetical protein